MRNYEFFNEKLGACSSVGLCPHSINLHLYKREEQVDEFSTWYRNCCSSFFFFFGIRYNCCCLFVTMQMVAIYLRNIYNFVDRIIWILSLPKCECIIYICIGQIWKLTFPSVIHKFWAWCASRFIWWLLSNWGVREFKCITCKEVRVFNSLFPKDIISPFPT